MISSLGETSEWSGQKLINESVDSLVQKLQVSMRELVWPPKFFKKVHRTVRKETVKVCDFLQKHAKVSENFKDWTPSSGGKIVTEWTKHSIFISTFYRWLAAMAATPIWCRTRGKAILSRCSTLPVLAVYLSLRSKIHDFVSVFFFFRLWKFLFHVNGTPFTVARVTNVLRVSIFTRSKLLLFFSIFRLFVRI